MSTALALLWNARSVSRGMFARFAAERLFGLRGIRIPVCAANEGRVRNSEPFAFNVASSTAIGAPLEAPKDTIRPRGRRLFKDASKEIRPIGS
jgi:hypothetical protein